MYNNFVKGSSNPKPEKKERRKPVSDNFVPKRMACGYDPPMIILEYMVPDSGKLYHHKMRLESKMQETFDVKQILEYLKKKHSLYFTKGNPKIKDSQVEELIERVVSQYEEYGEEEQQKEVQKQTVTSTKPNKAPLIKDFDFLDGDEEEDEEENEYAKEDWDLEMGEDADIV